MPKVTRFEDLSCWKQARIISKEIYILCRNDEFRKDFALANQTRRSAISIMANIAEGFARKGKREFIQFLYVAKSSAAELQSHLYAALDVGYVKKKDFISLYEKIDKVQRQTSNLIKYLTADLRRSRKLKIN
jgi:four helix bundle protein